MKPAVKNTTWKRRAYWANRLIKTVDNFFDF